MALGRGSDCLLAGLRKSGRDDRGSGQGSLNTASGNNLTRRAGGDNGDDLRDSLSLDRRNRDGNPAGRNKTRGNVVALSSGSSGVVLRVGGDRDGVGLSRLSAATLARSQSQSRSGSVDRGVSIDDRSSRADGGGGVDFLSLCDIRNGLSRLGASTLARSDNESAGSSVGEGVSLLDGSNGAERGSGVDNLGASNVVLSRLGRRCNPGRGSLGGLAAALARGDSQGRCSSVDRGVSVDNSSSRANCGGNVGDQGGGSVVLCDGRNRGTVLRNPSGRFPGRSRRARLRDPTARLVDRG